MPNIVDRFGQLVDDAIPKPELARQLLLLGYRAKDVQLLLAPEKELTPARQYAAQIAMDAMIAPLAHPQRAALVNIFMPCELLHANATSFFRYFTPGTDADALRFLVPPVFTTGVCFLPPTMCLTSSAAF